MPLALETVYGNLSRDYHALKAEHARLMALNERLAGALREFVRIDEEDANGLVCECGSDLVLALDAAESALAAYDAAKGTS